MLGPTAASLQKGCCQVPELRTQVAVEKVAVRSMGQCVQRKGLSQAQLFLTHCAEAVAAWSSASDPVNRVFINPVLAAVQGAQRRGGLLSLSSCRVSLNMVFHAWQ